MSEELVKSVQEMLKEETWTRAAISNYTKNNLIELAEIVQKAKDLGCINELKETCDEQLSHAKDSIIALYISGMLGLKKGALDNSALVNLIDIFRNNHKEPLVIDLCQSIIDEDPNNKFALRTLAECYREANSEEVWAVYEKIVKLDFEEADIAKILAEHYESSDIETAVSYYKKAILRYVNAGNVNSIKEIWTKLISLIPDEIDFFKLVQRKVEKTISPDKSAILMQELYPYYKDNKKWDTAIDILKGNLRIDPKDNFARREITDCFRAKYEKHSHVEDYIRSSNLTQSFRNVFEAISDFEKHIAFDAKNFVFHKTWHVGVIQKVENDTLTINFGKNGFKEMSLKMAVSALQPLSRNHIWVLKATTKKDVLAKKIKDDKTWALKTIISSFNGSCDFKRIKAELVPSLLTASEWTNWNSGAKRVLDTDPTFGVNPNNINEFTVREKAITPEEKLSNEFKAQKQFFPRIDILMKYVNADETDKESDLFADMFAYFKGFLKSINSVTEQVVASYLIVQKVGAMFPTHAYTPSFTFDEMYHDIDNPREMYELLKDTKNTSLREDFLAAIRLLPDWVEQYVKLFPTVLSKSLLDTLINQGKTKEVQELVADTFEDSRNNREAILFFFENCQNEEWFKATGISYQKQLISIINAINQCYREIENHVDSTENKKIIKNACKLLFEGENVYAKHMLSCDMAGMGHMYQIVDDIAPLEGSIKTMLRNKILEKYPDYKFHKKDEASSAPKGMWVTLKMLDAKKAEEKELKEVKIPANAQEIADARAKGDLKENAEYIAAKEYQHKLNHDLKRLEEELARAIVFDETTATASFISFGTDVVLTNKDSGKDEKYTILGPWESDPENGIISYMSPFGNEILDAKPGEELSFTINEHKYNYSVKKITVTECFKKN